MDLFEQLRDAAVSREDEVLEISVKLAQRLHRQAEEALTAASHHREEYELALRRRAQARDRLGAVLSFIHQLEEVPESFGQSDRTEDVPGAAAGGEGWLTAIAKRMSASLTRVATVQDPERQEPNVLEAPEPERGPVAGRPDVAFHASSARDAVVVNHELDARHHRLRAWVLGKFALANGGSSVASWSGTKGQSIFKYLLAQRGRAVHKEVLMELLWPDGDPEASRRSLHQAIYSLRKTLRDVDPGGDHVLFENDCYLLNPDLDIWVDAMEFEARAATGLRLETSGRREQARGEYLRADGLYRGPYLEDSLYDDWSLDERQRLWSLFLDVAWHLGELLMTEQRYGDSLALCRKVHGMDACNEKATRLMMRCYSAQGQRELAVRQYAILEDHLHRELATTPSADTRQLLRDILG
jgi:DNA-binding SARP family transcriptional activator